MNNQNKSSFQCNGRIGLYLTYNPNICNYRFNISDLCDYIPINRALVLVYRINEIEKGKNRLERDFQY